MTGRRSLDHAAPLVHQDARLLNAGIYNRGGNSELTLRFRDVAPSYVARGHGNTLEVVLAAPVARRAVVAAPTGRGMHPNAGARLAHAPPAAADGAITLHRRR